MHPGQRNSLDALCKRYDVDNSRRELHGALLDAQILLDVYLAMTGGQATLDSGRCDRVSLRCDAAAVERSRASAQPVARDPGVRGRAGAHDRTLAMLDKASGGRTVWRLLDIEPLQATA